MPWIDHKLCTGCAICVDECPVAVITMIEDVAEIDMDGCIRCGICHDICPVEAIKHDRLRIPDLVRGNVERTQRSMAACAEHLGEPASARDCLKRSIRHFENVKMTAERTLEQLNKLLN